MNSATDSHSTSLISHCRIVELPKVTHRGNGSLSVVDNGAKEKTVPFDIRRVFYLYDVPGDSERGGHSHHRAHELIVAASGSFSVTLTDGHDTVTYTLNRPYRGLYIPPGIWRGLNDFSSGAVCLVLTSEEYSEADYVRDSDEFKRLTAVKV